MKGTAPEDAEPASEDAEDADLAEEKATAPGSPGLQGEAKGGQLAPDAALALISRALRQRALRGLLGAVVTAGLAVAALAAGLIARRDESLRSDPIWLAVALALGLLRAAYWFGSRVRPGDVRSPERSPLRVSLEGDGGAVEAIGERVGEVPEVWVRMRDGEEIGLPVGADEVAPLVAFIRERSPGAGTFAPPGGRRPTRPRPR